MDEVQQGAGSASVQQAVPQATQEMVETWQTRVLEALTFWQAQFDLMRLCQKMVRGRQWCDDPNDERYVANILQRHVSGRTAAVYARNPRFVATPRRRLDFTLWDGNEQTLMMANQAVMQALQQGVQPLQDAQALVMDVAEGHQMRTRNKRIGQTLEALFAYFLDEGQPRFKRAAKRLVRRVRTNGVGFIKVGFQRATGRPQATEAQIADHRQRLGTIEALMARGEAGDLAACLSEQERLRTALDAMTAEPEIILREGLVFDFPASTAVIVDPCCTSLDGFVNADWVAQEFKFSAEKIHAIYGVDVSQTGRKYTAGGDKKRRGGVFRVWEIYDMSTQQTFTLCEGHKDWLVAPKAPDVWLEQFHPFFTLSFNDVEDEKSPYPLSDVELLLPQQREMNRAREAIRQHRIANRPAWVGPKGFFAEEDKFRLSTHASGEFLELDALSPSDDVDVRTKLQSKPTAPIDPATYETESVFQDVLRVSGDQEANLGGTGGGTATESTIAENSRMSSIQSNKDDLDDFLSEVARAAAQILILNMGAEQVQKIVGRGAFWPEMDRRGVADELTLAVAAGSTGRPNMALRVSMIERVAPFVQQVPGLNPAWWLKQLIQALDDSIDPTDAILEGMPSIVAMNANKQASTGDPATDPNAQGAQGANNAQRAPGTAGGGQAQFTPETQQPTASPA